MTFFVHGTHNLQTTGASIIPNLVNIKQSLIVKTEMAA